MRKIAVVCALAALAGCGGGEGTHRHAGAEAETAQFRIVLPDEPKPWEKTAAEELEHYLGLCLGPG